MSWFFPGSSHTYQAVPTEEGLLPSSHDRKTFDYDTIFSFKNNARDKSKYKSIFKFGEQKEKLESDYYRQLEGESEPNGPGCALVLISWSLNALAYLIFLLTLPIAYWVCVHRLNESERMVVFRLGKMQGVRGPGRVLIFPWLDKYKRVNIQASAFSVPPQQFISSDGGIVEMGAEVYYVITDVATMVQEVADHQDMLRSLSKSMLTKTLTKMTVAKLCKDRRLAVQTIAEELNVQVRKWGIHIQQVTLSDPKVLKKPEEKSAMAPILRNMGLKETQEFPSPEQFVRNNYGDGDDETTDAEAMNQLASVVGGFVQKCKKEDGKFDFSSLGGMMQGGMGGMGSMAGPVPGSQPLKLSDMGSLINPSSATSLQARKAAGPLTIDQKSDWHKCLESIICSDEVQLSSEAMGVYEIQVLETEHGTQGFYIDVTPVHRSVRVIIDERTPDVSVTITSSDLAGVLQGTLSPLQAYLTGRISAQGDVQKLMFFDKLSSRGHKPGSMFDI